MGKTNKAAQDVLLLSINRSRTVRALQVRHMGYEGASTHNSETDSLPPTKNLNGMASSPSSVPPIVRRANLMLGTRPALHIMSGGFAVFLRDSIKRVTIIGMILPG